MGPSAFAPQDRKAFVDALVRSLVECGDGRYDHLLRHPFACVEDGDAARIVQDGVVVADVSMCSLPTIGVIVMTHA